MEITTLYQQKTKAMWNHRRDHCIWTCGQSQPLGVAEPEILCTFAQDPLDTKYKQLTDGKRSLIFALMRVKDIDRSPENTYLFRNLNSSSTYESIGLFFSSRAILPLAVQHKYPPKNQRLLWYRTVAPCVTTPFEICTAVFGRKMMQLGGGYVPWGIGVGGWLSSSWGLGSPWEL